jgi:hypothetical protein
MGNDSTLEVEDAILQEARVVMMITMDCFVHRLVEQISDCTTMVTVPTPVDKKQ